MTVGAEGGIRLVVVDASTIVALVASGGSAADRIAAHLQDASLHAPHILPAEVDSALRRLVSGGKLTPAQGKVARSVAHGLPIELWPWSMLTDRAWELRENLSTYDAGYVALAERLGADLATGDARLARAPGLRCGVDVFG